MRPQDLPVAIVALLGIVAVVPAWTHFTMENQALAGSDAFLAALVLPAAVLMFTASWVKPQMAETVMGLFVLVGVMVMAPWIWEAAGLAASYMTDQPLAKTALQAALPLVVLAFVATMGMRRFARQ